MVLFALEANVTSHGVLAAGGALAMILGALMLVNSPMPGASIRLSTAFGVTLPLAAVTIILLRLAIAAPKRQAVTGRGGMIESGGGAETDLEASGKGIVHGGLWG